GEPQPSQPVGDQAGAGRAEPAHRRGGRQAAPPAGPHRRALQRHPRLELRAAARRLLRLPALLPRRSEGHRAGARPDPAVRRRRRPRLGFRRGRLQPRARRLPAAGGSAGGGVRVYRGVLAGEGVLTPAVLLPQRFSAASPLTPLAPLSPRERGGKELSVLFFSLLSPGERRAGEVRGAGADGARIIEDSGSGPESDAIQSAQTKETPCRT